MQLASHKQQCSDIALKNAVPVNKPTGSSWQASLVLSLGKTPRGTRLLSSSHRGPLYVQKPFYPEGPELAHVYLLHPPGGMVSGDELSIDLDIQAHSHALFTTPGAGRIYRARADRRLQHQQVSLKVAKQGSAEWFPLETIAYPSAVGKLTTKVELDNNAVFSGWEITCLGLPACEKPFNLGSLHQSFEIYRDGQLVFLERFHLDAENFLLRKGIAGLQGNTVNGLFVSGPFNEKESTALLETIRQFSSHQQPLLATTAVNDFLVTRYLGNCAQQARQLFVKCWQQLRPVLQGREACPPRIWST